MRIEKRSAYESRYLKNVKTPNVSAELEKVGHTKGYLWEWCDNCEYKDICRSLPTDPTKNWYYANCQHNIRVTKSIFGSRYTGHHLPGSLFGKPKPKVERLAGGKASTL
jgi:hypothetical protein